MEAVPELLKCRLCSAAAVLGCCGGYIASGGVRAVGRAGGAPTTRKHCRPGEGATVLSGWGSSRHCHAKRKK